MKQNNTKGHFRPRNQGRRNNGSSTIGVNTLIDSNGPCGRIKGTALQIMEKYLSTAKDANASDDRVLYENCMQHAEHFFRTHIYALNAEQERRALQVATSASSNASDRDDELEGENIITMNTKRHHNSDKNNNSRYNRRQNKDNTQNIESLQNTENDNASEEEISDNEDKLDIINLDLSFPDMSKLSCNDEKMEKKPVSRRGRPRKVKDDVSSLASSAGADKISPVVEDGNKIEAVKAADNQFEVANGEEDSDRISHRRLKLKKTGA